MQALSSAEDFEVELRISGMEDDAFDRALVAEVAVAATMP